MTAHRVPSADTQRRRFRVVTTNACNLACQFCFNEGYPTRGTLFIDKEVARNSIERSGWSVNDIKLTGGDPLLHPEIEEVAMHLEPLGRVSLTTNGLLLEARLQRMPAKVAITVSVYGTDEEEYARYTQRPREVFRRFCRQLDVLQRWRTSYAANVLIRPDTDWRADRYWRFCQSRGFSPVRFITMRGFPRERVGYADNLRQVVDLVNLGQPVIEPDVSLTGSFLSGGHVQLVTQYEDVPASRRPPGFVWIGPRGEVYEDPDPSPIATAGFTQRLPLAGRP
jgi:molybdenum cofactor biosynthesis enzyme MoaA